MPPFACVFVCATKRRQGDRHSSITAGHRSFRQHPCVQGPHLFTKEGATMPKKSTVKRAKKDLRQGKSPSTASGKFVHEEMEHIRKGKHGARSPQQAIAIGLSKARRAGVPLPPPAKGKVKESTRKSAQREYRKGQAGTASKPSSKRSRAREDVLKREPRSVASYRSLSKRSRSASRKRGTSARQRAAAKAVRTKGHSGLQQAARKAARSRSVRRKAA